MDDEFRGAWDSSYSSVPDEDVEKSWEEFRVHLKSHKKRNFAKAGLVAASFLVLFATYFFLEIHNPIITKSNFTKITKEVNLPDGSLVLLKPGATIRYKEYFKHTRGVELEGRAFFDVVKDSLKEFKVITGPTITKVLGTTFSVNATKENKDIEVALYTGRVLLTVNGKAESWGIIPGEKLLNRKGNICIKKFNPELSFETGNKIIDVNNMELGEVLDFLSKRFGYEFEKAAFTRSKKVTLGLINQIL